MSKVIFDWAHNLFLSSPSPALSSLFTLLSSRKQLNLKNFQPNWHFID
jgi:hypothetical protein